MKVHLEGFRFYIEPETNDEGSELNAFERQGASVTVQAADVGLATHSPSSAQNQPKVGSTVRSYVTM